MNITASTPIFEQVTALADDARRRILLLLERHELTVSELCAVVQLPQSTTSRHLKTLSEAGWVVSRRDGTRRLYSLHPGLETEATEIWRVMRAHVEADPTAGQDATRLESVLRSRRARSQEFFSETAADWDRVRDTLFGRGFYATALLGLLDADWTVGDLGCGTGRVAASLAPFVARVIAVDESPAMLAAARHRLKQLDNVEVRSGALESLPLDDGVLDVATSVLVLHHVAEPALVLAEAARTLRPGGSLLIVDMLPHRHHEYQSQMGHVWAGFSRGRIEQLLGAAGFALRSFHPLPPDPEARGPVLFVASARIVSNEKSTAAAGKVALASERRRKK